MNELHEEGTDEKSFPVLTTPRWYEFALLALCVGMAVVGLIATQFSSAIVFAVLAAALAIAIFVVRPRRRRAGVKETNERGATYGSATLLGVMFFLLGLSWIIFIQDYLMGVFQLIFGMLTVAAYGRPVLLRWRRRSHSTKRE